MLTLRVKGAPLIKRFTVTQASRAPLRLVIIIIIIIIIILSSSPGVDVLASVLPADDGRGGTLARHHHQLVRQALRGDHHHHYHYHHHHHLAHDGVRVLHHGVHGVGVVVLLRPRQRQALEVQPQLAHGGAGRAHPEPAGPRRRGRVRGGRVQRQVAPVLARLLAAARGEDAARAEAVRAAAAGPASVRGALRGGVAGAVGAEAGAARRVGELDHGEQAEHPGPQHGAGARD